MTLEQFQQTLANDSVPPMLSPALRAMWADAKGDWTTAHSIAQEIDGEVGSWIHAYLHRKEGDAGNARYWYRRAGLPPAHDTLEEEWARIVLGLLGARSSVLDHE